MAELPTLTIRRQFPRPEPELVARLRDAASGHVVDALGRRGALDFRIRAITSNCQFVGTALTVETRSRDNLAPWASLAHAQPGDVLVVATGGSTESSVIGDLMAGMACNRGVVAIVTDGLVRDIGGLNAMGIPVFARGVSPNSPFKTGPGSIGLPVLLAGERVEPGDVLVGDIDGVVVIPRTRLADAVRELEAVRTKEADMEERVKRGETEPLWLAPALARAEIRYVDQS